MKKFFFVILIVTMLFATSAAAKTHLVWSVHWTDFQVDGVKDEEGNVVTKGVQQYADEYMALNPDVEIEIQSVPFDDYLKKILISHTAGQVSDIYGLYSLWGVQLVESGILDAVPADIEKMVEENSVEAAYIGSSIDGKLRGIPMEIDNYALIYNKKIFAESGFDAPPSTWDEMSSMASKMTKKAADGTTDRYGFAFLSGWDSAVVHPYLSLLYSCGGRMFNDDFTECLLNSREALTALEKEIVLFKNGATDPAASVYGFSTGKAAMIIMAPWYETSLKIAFKEDYEETVGVAPFPVIEMPVTAGYTWFLGVDKSSKNKKEAWEFLKWLSFDKMENGASRLGELMALNIAAIPPMKFDIAAYPKELDDLYTSVFVKELANTVSEPNVAQGQEIKTILMREIVEAWHGQKTPEEALRIAKEEIDEILEEFYF